MIRTTTALAAAALVFGAASVTQTAAAASAVTQTAAAASAVTQTAAAAPACNSSYEGTTNDEYDPDPEFHGSTAPCQV
ncbi:hypothetical protein [Rhodococcus jostii]|uniref:Excalibur calcium-binding domain-containing protein n=1 Tax=Rhodococcus jostii TaxID=132919 RepID=A0A1H5HR78_RHOJO|nr:hypothetical protein [Rhodococcus jostii]SEE30251.1 hypothetical protein SAMN04490220_7306 [Rhodococcus jostii]